MSKEHRATWLANYDRSMASSRRRTQTASFGVGRREGHDASAFYERFSPPVLSADTDIGRTPTLLEQLGTGRFVLGDARAMSELPDNSVALVVTSPPYFVGKEYELAVAGDPGERLTVPESYLEYLGLLTDVFAECFRVLEPGGRIAVNVANLGRKPYRSLAADVIDILQNRLGLLLRGEIIWRKSEAAGGSCAWGSFARASNPVLRDNTERVVVAGKGAFGRALTASQRAAGDLPHESTITNDEFIEITNDVWEIPPESATRLGHPAPFPVELPLRLVNLYTYRGDIVLDPFAGSGSTVVAAVRAGRVGVGFDTDPDYVELAEQRLAAELLRRDRLDTAIRRMSSAPDPAALDDLEPEERHDVYTELALRSGDRAAILATRLLADIGFAVSERPRLRGTGVEFDLCATTPAGRRYWVDVAGSFTSTRSGMLRGDTVWRHLGKIHVLRATDPEACALLLTSSLPKPGTPIDRALRAVLDDRTHALELLHPRTASRLTALLG